jgi:hypothetical protein
MEPELKYFGMTIKQVAILAGLAVAACVLFGVTGMLLLRGRSGMSDGAPESTPLSQSTPAPFVLPTVAATETLTPIPYETLVPGGWVQFKTTLVEIWLPNGFEQADPKKFTDPGDMETHELVMTGTMSDTSLNTVLVMISYKPLTASSLDAQLDSDLAKMPENVSLVERKKAPEISPETVRLVLETRNGNSEMKQMTYVFQDGSTLWFVQYLAQISEFYELLDEFEKSVKTFRVVR